MKIIPVIDILNGIAVHGIQGKRKQYKPLKSILFNSTDPLEIALTLESLGFRGLYLADLDSIQGKTTNYSIYRQITTKTCLSLMVDSGIFNLTKAVKVLETGVSKIVIGSETLNNLGFICQALDCFGKDKVIVSIDYKRGNILSASNNIASMDTISFAKKLADMDVRQIILLDLDRVGTEHGINVELIVTILENVKVQVLVGGGIKSLQELEELRNLGVSGALVATVLHNGKVTIDELKSDLFQI